MARRVGYRDLKKYLNRYINFSFSMPPRGKDFTPQQKSALTRAFNKLQPYIRNVKDNRASFVQYPKKSKLPNVEGVRTNKGIFFKFPGAQVTQIAGKDKLGRKRKIYTVKTVFRKLRELFIPFPDDIINDIDSIEQFVEEVRDKYKPNYIMWSVNGFKGRTRYDPSAFKLYTNTLTMTTEDQEIRKAQEGLPYFNGVFIGYFPK